jgi:DNA repair photolyase
LFKGKVIYNPSGKAAEYSYWACNFYIGCSNNCSYCYLKKGITAKVLGGNKPKLKSCFKDEKHAIEVFEKELIQNKSELQKHGLFFSFTTDPALKETYRLTIKAIHICMVYDIPVKILTKSKITGFTMHNWVNLAYHNKYKNLIAIGNTLTGLDDLEPNAATNKERISGLKWLHDDGFKTFASIEPIIDIESSQKMIEQSLEYVDLFKIGLNSGQKYNSRELQEFWLWCITNIKTHIYFKDSFLKAIGVDDRNLMNGIYSNCVNRDFNLFKP